MAAAADMSDLVSRVDGIPSVAFHELEAELYFLKENIKNIRADGEQLDVVMRDCVTRARDAGNVNLELLLRWHQIESNYCRVHNRNPDDVKREMRADLDKLKDTAYGAIDSLVESEAYPKHVTLCRLFSYLGCGYADIGECDIASRMFRVCENKGWSVQPARTNVGHGLDEAHMAYFHYAMGRYYSHTVIPASRRNRSSRDCCDKKLAIENFELSKQHYTANSSTEESYHLCEIAMCYLQMTRVYLDVCPIAIHWRLPPEDIDKANNRLLQAIAHYDEYEEKSGRRAVRVDARIDWWQSLLYFRMYQTYTPTESASFKNILLERARFYCERSVVNLEKSAYSDKPRIRHLFLEITKKILPQPTPTDAEPEDVVPPSTELSLGDTTS